MKIRTLELENFRNYQTLKLDFDEGINIFCGDNAQGKTNLLEAVYLLCTSKSQKLAKDREMISFGEDESHLKTVVVKNKLNYRIDMHLRKNASKGIAVNSIPIRRASELFGIAHVISFSPEDLSIIKSGPSERRRFMDIELCQLDKIYVNDLISYNRVINQKNRLLKSAAYSRIDESFLDVYDEQLVKYGSEIIKARRGFTEKLDIILREISSFVTGSREMICLSYEPYVNEDDFAEELRDKRESEMKNMISLVGPHKDDISFFTGDKDLRRFGSQGQQRTAAVSLKLAELRIVEEMIGDRPILILDDVLAELDSHRQEMLLDAIRDTQTLISCTGLDVFTSHRFHIDSIFHVRNGRITGEDDAGRNQGFRRRA